MAQVLPEREEQRERQEPVDLILDELAIFYSKHAKTYAVKWGEYDPNLPPLYDRLLQLLPRRGRLLDSGCGPGRDMIQLARRGFDVQGISLTQAEVDIAAAREGLEGRVWVMDMRAMEFSGGSFDVVWDNAAFLHIPSQAASQVLREYHRVLCDEGLLFLRVKEGVGEGEIDASAYGRGETRFFKLYEQTELCDLVEKNGFDVIEADTRKGVDGRDIRWIHLFGKTRDST